MEKESRAVRAAQKKLQEGLTLNDRLMRAEDKVHTLESLSGGAREGERAGPVCAECRELGLGTRICCLII